MLKASQGIKFSWENMRSATVAESSDLRFAENAIPTENTMGLAPKELLAVNQALNQGQGS